jgi:hypothetical protein
MAFITSNTQPPNGALGDEWYNPVENVIYKMIPRNGTTPEWHGFGNTAANAVITTTYTQTNITNNTTLIYSQVGDVYWNSVSLLLDAPTSNTIINYDASNIKNDLQIVNADFGYGSSNSMGMIRASDFTPYNGANATYGSLYTPIAGKDLFYASGVVGPYLNIPSKQWGYYTYDFTVECWVRPFQLANYNGVFDQGDMPGPRIVLFSDGTVEGGDGTSNLATGAGNVSVGSWTHIAFTRQAGIRNIWINGIVKATAFTSAANINGSAPTYIGRTNDGFFLNGHIADLRVVVGNSLYSNFTVPTSALTSVANTQLLLAQSATIVDNSIQNKTVTVFGGAAVSSNSPFASGYSIVFDGSGDYLSIADTTMFKQDLDFTVEMWINVTARPGSNDVKLYQPQKSAGDGGGLLAIALDPAGKIVIDNQQTGNEITTAEAIPLGVWKHIALVRNGNSASLFVDGILANTKIYTNWQGTSHSAAIGRRLDTSTDYNGYISNFRLVRANALYGASFTLPTAPVTPTANTKLLTLQYNDNFNNKNSTVYDQGQYRANLVKFGNVTIGTFSPNRPNTTSNSYLSNVNGGSAYFDGSGDYIRDLSGTSNAAYTFTGDFTAEAWIYPQSLSGTSSIFCLGSENPARYVAYIVNGQLMTNKYGNTSTYYVGANVIGNVWSHVAFVRSNNTISAILNGNISTTSNVFLGNIGNGGFTLAVDSGASNPFYGYISGFRLAKQAVYTVGGNTPTRIPFTANASVIDTRPTANTSNSVYLNGGSYLVSSSSNVFGLGTGDFTIECWVNRTAWNSWDSTIVDFRQTGGASQVKPTLQFAGVDSIRFDQNGATRITTSGLRGNVWYHVALVRYNANTKLYVGGVPNSTTYVDTNNYGTGVQDITIGQVGDNKSFSSGYFNGYITNLKITKGLALYTSAFTPSTTPLTPTIFTGLANVTSLLTLQGSNVDNSGRGITFTNTGTIAGSPYSPFGTYIPEVLSTNTNLLLNFTSGGVIDYTGQGNFETANVGFSGNVAGKFNKAIGPFRKNDTYITIPHNAIYDMADAVDNKTQYPFTIEYWIYPTSFGAGLPSGGGVVLQKDGRGGTAYPQWRSTIKQDGLVGFEIGNATTASGDSVMSVSSNIAVTGNVWNHVAHTRNTANVITTYINGNVALSTLQNRTQVPNFGPLTISTQTNSSGDGFFGYLENVRITKGVCRYTAPFTPDRANTYLGYPVLTSSSTSTTTSVSVVAAPNVTAVPTRATTVNYLIVAGGGAGGGGNGGGGGGAGGLLSGTISVTPGSPYTITVGAGGATQTANGTPSTALTLTATGGGGGSGETGPGPSPITSPGGSGGGGGSAGGTSHTGGQGITSPVRQGYPGGNGLTDGGPARYGGGGGGAGGAGTTGAPAQGGPGGIGFASNIAGTSTYYAGGGGGGNYSGPGFGVGGTGGGGNGGLGTSPSPGSSGQAYRGGGGGGGGNSYPTGGASGGGGVVIISYPTANILASNTGSNVIVSNVGGNVIHAFYASGTITF